MSESLFGSAHNPSRVTQVNAYNARNGLEEFNLSGPANATCGLLRYGAPSLPADRRIVPDCDYIAYP